MLDVVRDQPELSRKKKKKQQRKKGLKLEQMTL